MEASGQVEFQSGVPRVKSPKHMPKWNSSIVNPHLEFVRIP